MFWIFQFLFYFFLFYPKMSLLWTDWYVLMDKLALTCSHEQISMILWVMSINIFTWTNWHCFILMDNLICFLCYGQFPSRGLILIDILIRFHWQTDVALSSWTIWYVSLDKSTLACFHEKIGSGLFSWAVGHVFMKKLTLTATFTQSTWQVFRAELKLICSHGPADAFLWVSFQIFMGILNTFSWTNYHVSGRIDLLVH